MANMESRNNTIYKAVNFYTIRGPELNMRGNIQEYEVFVMPKKDYSIEQLAEIDDTMRVVKDIEVAIKDCGYKMMDSGYELDFYDKNYNFLEYGEEYKIELGCYPGLLVDEEDYARLKKTVKLYRVGFSVVVDFPKKDFNLMLNSAFKNKVPIVVAKTLKVDYYEELENMGINVVNDRIFGIVDIKKLWE